MKLLIAVLALAVIFAAACSGSRTNISDIDSQNIEEAEETFEETLREHVERSQASSESEDPKTNNMEETSNLKLDSPEDIVFSEEIGNLLSGSRASTEFPEGYSVVADEESDRISIYFSPESQNVLPLPSKHPSLISVLEPTSQNEISASQIRDMIFDHYKELEASGIPSFSENILDDLIRSNP